MVGYTTIDPKVSSRPQLLDSDTSWERVPFQVEFGDTFMTMADAIKYALNQYDKYKVYGEKDPDLQTAEDLDAFAGMPSYIGKPYFKDTRLGANDGINCIWQFNRDDDIVHDMMRSDTSSGIGMGRVYASTVEQNQSIVWLSFGVPKYTDVAEFFLKSVDADLVKFNNTGFSKDISWGKLFGDGVRLFFSLATVPLTWLWDIMESINDYHVDKFYDLRITMHIYYKYVDSMLAEWLVNTGIYDQGPEGGETEETKKSASYTASQAKLPLALREAGPSVWDILRRKAINLGVNTDKNTAYFEETFQALSAKDKDDYDSDPENPWGASSNTDWETAFAQTAFGATQFIGLRIEKNVDASESFSNSTTPSPVAEAMNAQSREAAQTRHNIGHDGQSTNTDGFLDGLTGFFSGATDMVSGWVGMDGIASALTGGACIDIPEQYSGSDFGKSHSLSFQLRSPYGDLTSIYQSIMVPLFMILAGALPRTAGPHAYTQPFLCRAYAKGLFSIPMGIIESVTIKRGSSEFGWTYQNLPTCVDVTISIKDLSPIMYMNITDSSFKSLWGTNSSFSEFLLTLAGTGLFERISRWTQIRRNMQYSCHQLRNTYANPMYHASWISELSAIQFISALMPNSAISHN